MRAILCLVLCFSLSACLTTGKRGNDTALAVYDLGLPQEKTAVSSRLTATAIEVRAPLWLDTMGIDYRLLYADPARLREYGRARWAGPPTQLIQQRLSGQARVLPAGQGRSNCLLRLEITEFSQLFDTPERSRGVLHGHVELLDKMRVRIAERRIVLQKPAATPDSRGAVGALSAVVEQLLSDLLAWEKSLSGEKRAAACAL